METILANYSASISELKKNPGALLKKSQGAPVTILNYNKPVAYYISAENFEGFIKRLRELEFKEDDKYHFKEHAANVGLSVDEL